MEIIENEGRGTSVILVSGDDLGDVPDSHLHLLTPQLRDAFSDPVERFREIAKRSPFPEMSRWLNSLLEAPQWQLQLHQGDPLEYVAAGYFWASETVRSATIDLPSDAATSYPTALAEYFSLVGSVDWMGFGCAGGLSGATGHAPLRDFDFDYHGADISIDDVSVWGCSPSGDMNIWSTDDRGGWLSLGSGHIHFLGTIEDSINWIYSKLNSNECPEYDYEWAK